MNKDKSLRYRVVFSERGGKYYVEKTKTEWGCRFIPMTEEVYQSLKNILANRPKLKTEAIIDGYSSFLLIDKDNHPKVVLHIENGVTLNVYTHASYDRAAEQMTRIAGFHRENDIEKQRKSG